MANHDHGYKLLFQHPQMVADLIRGFVHEPWVAELDYQTLERVPDAFISDDLRERRDDIIWRIRWRNHWLYLYLLIEFQSSVDRFMSVRISNYVMMLYQDLIASNQLSNNHLLPPVFPIVLYNGKYNWTAPTELSCLIEPVSTELSHYRPQQRYLLLDEKRITKEDMLDLSNLVAGLFRFEQCQSLDEIRNVLNDILCLWNKPELANIRRAFAIWLSQVFIPHQLPSTQIPEIQSLQEMDAMLAERVQEWYAEKEQKGRVEGLQEGEARLLIRLLTKKFGPLSPTQLTTIHQADADQLLVWSERLLEAQSIDEIIGAEYH